MDISIEKLLDLLNKNMNGGLLSIVSIVVTMIWWEIRAWKKELMEIKLYEDSTLFNEEWVKAKLEEEKNNGR